MQAFLHGFVLAIGLILPLGVQNLFVFNQGATQTSFLGALPVIISASVCDTFLILMSVQGISLFLFKFGFFKIILVSSGIVFLCYMGWLTWKNTIVQSNDVATRCFSMKQQIVFAVTVSLLNPHAVLDTVVVIGTSSVNYAGADKLLFTGACIFVSWGWFLFLAGTGRIMGSQTWFANGSGLINKISAILMWASACYMLVNAL